SQIFNLHLSTLFFAFAFVTHTMLLLWFPFLLLIVYQQKKQKLGNYFLFTLIYLAIFTSIKLSFISNIRHETFMQQIQQAHNLTNDIAQLSPSLKSVLIIMRNFFVNLMRNNTSLIVILA